MKKYIILLPLLCSIAFSQSLPTKHRGEIIPQAGDEFIFYKPNEINEAYALKLKFPEKSKALKLTSSEHAAHLRSLLDLHKLFQIEGIVNKEEKTISLDYFPAMISGELIIKGKFKKYNETLQICENETLESCKNIFIPELPNVNGFSFDEISLNYFNDKKVIAHLSKSYNSDFKHELTSIILDDVYRYQGPYQNTLSSSAKTDDHLSDENLIKKQIKLITQKNDYNQGTEPVVLSLGSDVDLNEKNNLIIVSYSGRQGDAGDAIAGHITSGTGSLSENGEMNFDIHNYYPAVSEKLVKTGSISHVDYFGQLTAGQINYRPTFSIVLYGHQKIDLQKMSFLAQDDFHYMRTNPEKETTLSYNCTTTTWDNLNEIGIKGDFQKFPNNVLNLRNFAYLNPLLYLTNKDKYLYDVSKMLTKSRKEYLPRRAFDEILASSTKLLKDKKIKRMDFIFHPQVPSARPVGGAAAKSFSQMIKYFILHRKFMKDKISYEQLVEEINELD